MHYGENEDQGVTLKVCLYSFVFTYLLKFAMMEPDGSPWEEVSVCAEAP